MRQIELLFPLPRPLLQQGVGLRLPQFQVLEEVHQPAHRVERRPDDVHLIGDGQHDFRPELATAEDAGDLAVWTVRAAIDSRGHEHRSGVISAPTSSLKPTSLAATWARTTPARLLRSVIASAAYPSSAARRTSSSGCEAPSRKKKLVLACRSA
jgi:hypothetical protein